MSAQQEVPPSEKQINYLKRLGYTGDPPTSIKEASQLIEKLAGNNTVKSTNKTFAAPTPVKTIDTTKIDLHASELEVIRKETHEIVQVILAQAAQVHTDCAAVGYDNPAFEGLVLKEVRERIYRKSCEC